MTSTPKFDVFISHASEDKDAFVQPLAETLRAFGVKVWYDKFSLRLGDSLSRSIDRGLAASSFGLVVLSPSFFAKNWPEHELQGLVAKEVEFGKVILPIWHNISKQDLIAFSPTLADKFAIKSDSLPVTRIATAIIDVVRPDLLEKIVRRAAFLKSKRSGKTETIELSKIKFGPPAHDELPFNLVSRVRLIRAALLGVHTHSMQHWIDGFRGDSHPSREIRIWEHVAACYLEYTAMTDLSSAQCNSVFGILFSFSCCVPEEDVRDKAKELPSDAFKKLQNLWIHAVPVYDIEDKPFPMEYASSNEEMERLKTPDKETFPYDIPDELVFEILGQEPIDDEAAP